MKINNKLGLPQFVIEALTYSDYDKVERDPYSLSVTELIDSPYIWSLKQQYSDYVEVEASDMMWSMIGQIGHEIASRSGSNIIKELRMNMEFGKWKLRGKFDIFDISTKTLVDNKFTTFWTLVYNPEGKPEWHRQTNVYAYMMRKMGLDVQKIQIITWLRDLNKTEKLKADRPSSDIVPIDIPVWSDAECEAYINSRLKLFENISEPCSKEERWAKDTVYAVKKLGSSRAINGGLFNSYDAAFDYISLHPGHEIEVRQGEDVRCENYCNINKFCNYYKEKYGK